jgi:phospholipase/carboxylesterase
MVDRQADPGLGELRVAGLKARPGGGAGPAAGIGAQELGLARGRDGLTYVPHAYRPDTPAPLLVLLHGAGGRAADILAPFTAAAEAGGILLLAPDSRGRTWDVILGAYGADVDFLDRALDRVFDRFAVSAARIAVGGFSDGASYALSIGLINGALFRDILAFAPGFAAPTRTADAPRIFVAHGIRDDVLPIDACSRRLVPALVQAGYDVDYREFVGGHVVPPEMVDAAIARFLT